MRTKLTILFAVFACLTIADHVAQSAHAQGPFGDRPETAREGDANRLDLGKPLNPKPRPTPAQLIERLDNDQDQKLSAEEVQGRMKKQFAKIDADQDGFVTAAELQTMMDSRGKKGGRANRRGGGQEIGDRGGKGDKQQRRVDPAKLIKRLDADGDGKLSQTELPEKMQRRFQKLDSNADGFIEASELSAAMQKRSGGGKKRGGKKGGAKQGQRDRGGDGGLKPVAPKAPPADFPL